MRCSKRRKNGEPCKGQAISGTEPPVCRMHGGSAPQVRRAAERRQTEARALAEATRMVERAGVDVPPMEHLLDSLHQAAQLVKVWGAMVAEIDRVAEEETAANAVIRGELGYEQVEHEHGVDVVVTPKDRLLAVNSRGEARIHPYVEQLDKWIERRAKFAKLCLDAGIAEWQMSLLEQQVELAHRALEATLDGLDLDPTKKQEARREYARHLRAVA